MPPQVLLDAYIVYAACAAPIGLALFFFAISSIRGWTSRPKWTVMIVGGVLSCFLAAIAFVAHYGATPPYSPEKLAYYVALFVAFLATTGWMVTSHLTFVNNRKSHTMTVLIQARNNSIYQNHVYNVFQKYDISKPLTIEAVDKLKKITKLRRTKRSTSPEQDVAQSILYIMNFLEFVSVGINSGDLDRKMMKNSYRSIMLHWYSFAEEYIEEARRDDMGVQNKKIFKEFRKVVKSYGGTIRKS